MRSLSALLAAAVVSYCTAALAQTSVSNDRFSVNRFAPAPGPGNYFSVDGATVGGHMTPAVSLMLDYAYKPLVLRECSDEDQCGDTKRAIVKHMTSASFMGAMSFLERVQVGLVVPVRYSRGDSFAAVTGPGFDSPLLSVRGGKALSLGDPELSVKGRFWGSQATRLAIGARAFVTAPVAQRLADEYFLGDDAPMAGARLTAELLLERYRAALNIGGRWRKKQQLLATEVGPELTYAVAGMMDLTPQVALLAEVTGATRFDRSAEDNPIEAEVGAQLSHGDFSFRLGAGAGLTAGVGAPRLRVVAGAAWAPQRTDTDGDGIRDLDDRCPSEPEDLDGYRDTDGCPDPDNDGDGILDSVDRCPDEAEDADGNNDTDGCPDRDNDGDGIEDGFDSCPQTPEDIDGDRDDDGCPDADRDRDGVDDEHDQCPNEPEDTDGLGDSDGCPEEDFDEDGVPDDEDECPEEPEDLDGFEDTDGCPEEGEPGGIIRRRRG